MPKAVIIIGLTVIIIAIVWPIKSYFQNKKNKKEKTNQS